ncbi:MAG: bifunctional [glutamate--ammonia ligase]-adenylyl-L-tyrosine phosphorylase/[glutamate--ammonia-ligase] adenylyltransferase, partial [Gammaproteobacteria bacterium]
MLNPPPENALALLQQEFDAILVELKNDPILVKHKDEVLAVWYASPFIKRVCMSQTSWLQALLNKGELHNDCDLEVYCRQLSQVVSDADSVEVMQQQLRIERTSAFARIAWRDLQHYSTVQQTLHELSAFAEVCVQETLQWCFEWLRSRSSASNFVKQLPQQIVIFALGKLGGGELNFSSDIDIVFVYADDPSYTQEQAGKAVEFYLKVVQLFIKILSEQTQDGFVFRVDVRLRPFGNSGTLIPSFSSIDQYFQTHGRDWERYAWMKARVVAGDRNVGERFLEDVTPFIYRRYLDYGAIQALREMKALIDTKAKQESAKENLKIGFGGIREIEFIAQMFQLIYAGKDSSLQIGSTLQALKQLEAQGLLASDWVENLTTAYLFLRKAENGLQLREDQQIHSLPIEHEQQERYAYLNGMQDWKEFYAEYKMHTSIVNGWYQSLLENDDEANQDSCRESEFEKVWLQVDE